MVANISVIIPVFNAEDTLERCVGSVLSQTHIDISVVLVDDGSYDISGAMCDAYADHDGRVKVFHTTNRGLSAARNLGLDYAIESGSSFIAFVDADDRCEPQMLEELYAALDSSGADVALCGYRIHGFRETSDIDMPSMEYSRREAVTALVGGVINSGMWNKLYRSRVFEGLRFPEGRVYEEIATMHRVVLRCEKIVSVSFIGYHYIMREGSIAHTNSMKNLADLWIACKERYDCLIDEEPVAHDERLTGELAKGPAYSISKTWRWAYGAGAEDLFKYADVFDEMQRFERDVLRGVDKSSWPLRLRLSLPLARSSSSIVLAMAYLVNQALIHVFPKKSLIRR